MWQSHQTNQNPNGPLSSGSTAVPTSLLTNNCVSAAATAATSSANVSRFQLRSVSAEQLCGGQSSSSSHGGTAALLPGFRPLLPLLAGGRSNSSSIACSPTTFVDENSCSNSSTFVDCDALMTFKSYDLNDEYWLNFDQ